MTAMSTHLRDLEVHLPHRPGALADLGQALGAAGVSLEGGGPVGQVDLQVPQVGAHRRHPTRTVVPTSTGIAREDAT